MRPLSAALLLSLLLVSPSTQSAGESPCTQVEIERILKEWQSRLGLNAWKIEVHLVSPGSLGTDENGDVTVADITYDGDTSSAIVRVEQALHYEVEEGLLHELVHLKLAAWQPPPTSSEEEQTVDTLAFALLHSKRSD